MKIVVLNECFLKDDHVKRLKVMGDLQIYTDTDNEQKALDRIKDADIIIADPFVAPLNKNVIEAANNLKLIDLSVIGYDMVDVETANKQNIKIANIPGFCTEAVAELAFGLMLSVMRNIIQADSQMRQQPFEVDAGNPSHALFKGIELRGKKLGVVGLGRIGQRVAEIGKAFRMEVFGYDRKSKDIEGLTQTSLENLFKNCDVLSLHMAFNSETEGMISAELLKMMKPSAVLINTTRAKLVDEKTLYKMLSENKIAGAGFDVLGDNSSENPILKLNNVVLTPHEGYLTDGSVENMAEMVVKNAEAFMQGNPINIIP